MKDLIVLAADKDAKFGLESLLKQLKTENSIRPILFDCEVHAERDAGVRKRAEVHLRSVCREYDFALAIFDLEGCGREHVETAEQIEEHVETRLHANGWEKRGRAIVIVPELEAWLWDLNFQIRNALDQGWSSHSVRTALESEKFVAADQFKPKRPKEAFDYLLRKARKPRSSSLFAEIAPKIQRKGCADRAFQKLMTVLNGWFPAEPRQSLLS